VKDLRTIFPEDTYQVYTPNGTPDEDRIFYVTSNDDAPPYEAWISNTALRNHRDTIVKLFTSRPVGVGPDHGIVRELVRDTIIIALDVSGNHDRVHVESYTLEEFPSRPFFQRTDVIRA
jgi:hypothetical protein